jgi:hypothetical protein
MGHPAQQYALASATFKPRNTAEHRAGPLRREFLPQGQDDLLATAA